MAYMQTSEQVVSMIAVGTLVDEQGIVASGGYLVQLLPEVGRGPLMVMTERLRDWESIDAHLLSDEFSPSWLLDQLLYGMPFTPAGEARSASDCWCDELRVVEALATLESRRSRAPPELRRGPGDRVRVLQDRVPHSPCSPARPARQELKGEVRVACSRRAGCALGSERSRPAAVRHVTRPFPRPRPPSQPELDREGGPASSRT